MPEWTVTLSGDSSNLRLLVDLAVGVTVEGSAFVFRSRNLDKLTDSRAVQKRADELIEVLNGVARTEDYDFKPVAVGGILGDDRGRTFVLTCPADMTWKGGVTVVRQTSGAGQSATPSPSQYAVLAAVAEREPRVEHAFRLFGHSADPVNLYRIFEVIKADAGGEKQLITNGWTTRTQVRRFRHTVDSVTVLGADARHGVEPTVPPSNPMSIGEARAFVTRLLEKWVASK